MDINIVKLIIVGAGLISCFWIGIWLVTSEKGESFFSFASSWLLTIWIIFGLGAWGEYNNVLENRRQATINKKIISLQEKSTFYLKGTNESFKIDSLSIDTNIVFSGNKFYPIYKIQRIQ